MKTHTVKFSRGRLFTAFASATLLFASSAAAQNVGIGVSNPQSKLSVNGTTASGGIAVGDSTYTNTSCTVAPVNGAMIQGFTSIGTTKTRGRLTVVNDNGRDGTQNAQISLVSYGTSQTYFSFGAVSNLIHSTGVTGTNTASAVFHDNVWSSSIFVSYSGSVTGSDARLKNVIGHSDSAKDLETLKKIEITDYTMKDVVKEGDAPSKKVIGQQVEKVYPTAVQDDWLQGTNIHA